MPEYEIRMLPKDGKPELKYFVTYPNDETARVQATSIKNLLNADFEIWCEDRKVLETEIGSAPLSRSV